MIDAEQTSGAEAEATEASEIDATAENMAVERESEPEGGEGSGAEAPAEPGSDADDAKAVDAAPIADEIPADFTVPMTHPDNGAIDGVETEQRGDVTVFLVPQPLVATYESHGFVNIAGEDS